MNPSNLPINTIVVPQGAEYQAVCRGLKLACLKSIQVKDIRVIPIPIGTRDVLPTLVNRSFEFIAPQGVLIMGMCGGLTEQDPIGKALLYEKCCNFNRENLDLNSELTTKIKQRLSVELVTGLTSDRPICKATEKLKLGQKYAARVVDMEGFGYIKELKRQGMNVAMLRVVCDGIAGNIPDLSPVIDKDGNLKSWPMAIAFLQQPIAAMRLVRGSLIALKVLQQVTTELFV